MEKPKHLPPHLADLWDELVVQVAPRIGAVGLEALCVQVHRMRDAQARITAEGAIVTDNKGGAIPHPALAIEKAAQSEVRAWMLKYAARR